MSTELAEQVGKPPASGAGLVTAFTFDYGSLRATHNDMATLNDMAGLRAAS